MRLMEDNLIIDNGMDVKNTIECKGKNVKF